MKKTLTLGMMVGVATGATFAVVSAIEGGIAMKVGAVNASLIENTVAGLMSVIALTILYSRGKIIWGSIRGVLPNASIAGVLVIAAVAGIGYALPRIGVAAGNVAMLFGQMVIAFVIDTMGLVGYERIPLSFPRVAGLLLMALGTYLVMPRSS
jgi:transporter family-2 protein